WAASPSTPSPPASRRPPPRRSRPSSPTSSRRRSACRRSSPPRTTRSTRSARRWRRGAARRAERRGGGPPPPAHPPPPPAPGRPTGGILVEVEAPVELATAAGSAPAGADGGNGQPAAAPDADAVAEFDAAARMPPVWRDPTVVLPEEPPANLAAPDEPAPV